MYEVKVKITGISTYSQGKYVDPDNKLEKESAKDFEARLWREKMHYNEKDEVYIPLNSIKNCLTGGAAYLSIQIPGKGKSTYTKHFKSGITVLNHIPLNVKKMNAKSHWLFIPTPGTTKRVSKCFPIFNLPWGGITTIKVLDETITKEILLRVLQESGTFIGLGVFRPQNNGYFGRFEAEFVKDKK